MPRRENCVSACTNLIQGLADQNGGNRVATAATVVFGSSNDILVTVRIVSNKKVLVRVTNCSFYMKNY